jgi:hypothetical protein
MGKRAGSIDDRTAAHSTSTRSRTRSEDQVVREGGSASTGLLVERRES